MRGNIEAYKLWAPKDALWTEWVKPVLFANMPNELFLGKPDIPALTWMSHPDRAAAVIVDLPGKDGALEGVALARIGYRPVPLYNGVCGFNGAARVAVQTFDIVDVLCSFAGEVSRMNIRPDAPPAFLLDANRMREFNTPGGYDNRWCVFPQDMPSAATLADKGIRSVIVRTDKLRDDLTHILRRYEAHGMTICLHDGAEQKRITVPKPSPFTRFSCRFLVMMGLRRNAAGGFGGIIPESGNSHRLG
ncbi:MAG: hypothetical protein FWF84_06515 [Kiritimatiellaeota bacterium]|nr:hypothetical protein [Kiritimatiellota bacterium]